MKIMLLVAALALSGCATIDKYATCPNARAAVEAAQRAADALCPAAPVPDAPVVL